MEMRSVTSHRSTSAPPTVGCETNLQPAGGRTALEKRISLLVHRVNARFTQIANKLLMRQGINMYESRILLFLLKRGEVRVGELVEAMALPQSTISHQLKRLKARKFIRRRRARKDNRSVEVTLTPAGEAVARACELYSVYVQRGLIESFSASQIDKLSSLLEELFDMLDVSRFSPEDSGAAAAGKRARRPQCSPRESYSIEAI
jgi:DNA-binding MarR family transcriptional regulator